MFRAVIWTLLIVSIIAKPEPDNDSQSEDIMQSMISNDVKEDTALKKTYRHPIYSRYQIFPGYPRYPEYPSPSLYRGYPRNSEYLSIPVYPGYPRYPGYPGYDYPFMNGPQGPGFGFQRPNLPLGYYPGYGPYGSYGSGYYGYHGGFDAVPNRGYGVGHAQDIGALPNNMNGFAPGIVPEGVFSSPVAPSVKKIFNQVF